MQKIKPFQNMHLAALIFLFVYKSLSSKINRVLYYKEYIEDISHGNIIFLILL